VYITEFFPVVFSDRETWSVTLTERHGLRMFESRVLMLCGPLRVEVAEEWRKLHYEEL
jgi:hypothetical protein